MLKVKLHSITSLLLLVLASTLVSAQIYPPGAGQAGTTAMHKDSSAFINWASSCVVERGFKDISVQDSGYASVGDSSMATGIALSNGIVSLGDGGKATCTFPLPILDAPGYDFAVFENSFSDTYLELAHVEVSSDGLNYFRFPSHSLTDTSIQVGPFDTLNPQNLHNLAGKYRAGYGTPFDISDLPEDVLLDKNAIRYVRIIDCVGSINDEYASIDSYGNKINDPWPTPYPSSGFDLDAIGVIHENVWYSIDEAVNNNMIAVYPNPVEAGNSFTIAIQEDPNIEEVCVYDYLHRLQLKTAASSIQLNQPGTYFIQVKTKTVVQTVKIVVF